MENYEAQVLVAMAAVWFTAGVFAGFLLADFRSADLPEAMDKSGTKGDGETGKDHPRGQPGGPRTFGLRPAEESSCKILRLNP
jgi:hypothetical protein